MVGAGDRDSGGGPSLYRTALGGADPRLAPIGTAILLVAVCWAFWRWRRANLVDQASAVGLTFLTVTGGFGVQYLLWPTPFQVARPNRWTLRSQYAMAAYAGFGYLVIEVSPFWSRHGVDWYLASFAVIPFLALALSRIPQRASAAASVPQPAPDLPAGGAPVSSGPDPIGAWLAGVGRTVAANKLFTAALGIAALFRFITMLGYRWVFWFFGDSISYVADATHLKPGEDRPTGYSFVLRILEPFHSFVLVGTVQHVAGLGVGILVYLVARRHGMSERIATLVAVPVLFDAYEIQTEHSLVSEVWFILALVAALAIVLWKPERRGLPVGSAAVVGLLLGVASTLRTIGVPVIAVFVVCLLLRGIRIRALLATVVAAAVPLLGYMTWWDTRHGDFEINDTTGAFLWARTAAFADCSRIHPPADERYLCYDVPPSQRPDSSNEVCDVAAPIRHAPDGQRFSHQTNVQDRDFARRAILAQPGDYASVVLDDLGKTFAWDRSSYPGPLITGQYEFPTHAADMRVNNEPDGQRLVPRFGRAYAHYDPRTQIVRPWAGVMRQYQDWIFVRGTMLAVALALGMAGAARSWRRLGGHALLPTAVGLTLILVPPMTVDFDYRYLLPVIPVLSLAAALGARDLRGLIPRRAVRHSAGEAEATDGGRVSAVAGSP